MQEPFVHYEKDGRLATVLMNRPESRNAIGSQQDCRDVIDAFVRAAEDPGVSCIILATFRRKNGASRGDDFTGAPGVSCRLVPVLML